MSPIKAFENEEESLSIGDLTVENRTDRVALYGHVQFTRDRKGLELARQLKSILDDVVTALEAMRDLPAEVTLTNTPRTAKNPFS